MTRTLDPYKVLEEYHGLEDAYMPDKMGEDSDLLLRLYAMIGYSSLWNNEGTITDKVFANTVRNCLVIAYELGKRSRDEKEYPGNLDTGKAIVRLQGRIMKPFLINIPEFDIRNGYNSKIALKENDSCEECSAKIFCSPQKNKLRNGNFIVLELRKKLKLMERK